MVVSMMRKKFVLFFNFIYYIYSLLLIFFFNFSYFYTSISTEHFMKYFFLYILHFNIAVRYTSTVL